LATSSATDVWEALAAEAAAESPLWGEALRPSGEQERVAVFSTLFDSVTERAPEIGLWKALGAEPEKIAAVFLAEAAVNGLLGGCAGAVIGFLGAPALARLVFGFAVPRTPLLAAVAIAAAVTVSVAASLAPIRRALALEPIAALREG